MPNCTSMPFVIDLTGIEEFLGIAGGRAHIYLQDLVDAIGIVQTASRRTLLLNKAASTANFS